MKKFFLVLLVILFSSLAPVMAEEYSADVNAYMKDMEIAIKSLWKPPVVGASKQVVLSYEVGKDGNVSNVKVYKSSGNLALDNSALEALEKVKPLGPLPKELDVSGVNIRMTFDYNVHFANFQTGKYILAVVSEKSPTILMYKSVKSPEYKKIFNTYMYNITASINNIELASSYDKQLMSYFKFDILADGTVKNVKVTKTSGNKNFDDEIRNNLEKMQFKWIPTCLRFEKIKVEYRIGNNVSSYSPLYSEVGVSSLLLVPLILLH